MQRDLPGRCERSRDPFLRWRECVASRRARRCGQWRSRVCRQRRNSEPRSGEWQRRPACEVLLPRSPPTIPTLEHLHRLEPHRQHRLRQRGAPALHNRWARRHLKSRDVNDCHTQRRATAPALADNSHHAFARVPQWVRGDGYMPIQTYISIPGLFRLQLLCQCAERAARATRQSCRSATDPSDPRRESAGRRGAQVSPQHRVQTRESTWPSG
ncbi:unannotated protein [freshwater metagenome]|uniref:Unannotated protein n=1 Tax=freshwater metagenome TaxID=449393 RepID=A0A6J6EE31_9ZZZZ